MVLLPFGERVLFDLPAVSSSPGHTPTHEARSFCDSKAAASAPTSAIISVADSTPKPATSSTLATVSLLLRPPSRPPQPLFRIRYNAQNQSLCPQPCDHPFAVCEIVLSAARPAVGFGLAQVQLAGHLASPVPLLPRRLPIQLQRSPYRLPILRGRFHYYFLYLLLQQPLRQHLQLLGTGAELAPLKLIFPLSLHVSHHYR